MNRPCPTRASSGHSRSLSRDFFCSPSRFSPERSRYMGGGSASTGEFPLSFESGAGALGVSVRDRLWPT